MDWTCKCHSTVVTKNKGDVTVYGDKWYVLGNDKTHIVCKDCDDRIRIGFRIISADHTDSMMYKQAKGL